MSHTETLEWNQSCISIFLRNNWFWFVFSQKIRIMDIGYADAGYLSNPHKVKYHIEYMFTCGGTTISCRLQKQTLVPTFSNRAEVIVLHVTNREYVWLRSMTQYIQKICGLPINRDPTVLFEDNIAFITQIKEGYSKSILSKFLFI